MNATFEVQKGRSHSVLTWQDAHNEKARRNLLARRNWEKEKTTRLMPSFGPPLSGV